MFCLSLFGLSAPAHDIFGMPAAPTGEAATRERLKKDMEVIGGGLNTGDKQRINAFREEVRGTVRDYTGNDHVNLALPKYTDKKVTEAVVFLLSDEKARDASVAEQRGFLLRKGLTRTQAEAALRQAKDLQKRSDEQTRKTCAAMARNESATDFGCQRLREHMRAERERREKGEGGDEDGGGVVEGDEDGDGISEHFVPTAGDAFIGGVDQAIAGVDSVVDEAFDSGFIDLLGR